MSNENQTEALCNGFIEAGWLAVIIVIPLFDSSYSYSGFEKKHYILRSIADLMLIAWVVKIGMGGSPFAGVNFLRSNHYMTKWKQVIAFFQMPLLMPLLILITSYLISTILSISPRISWWGYYLRSHGMYTHCSYLIIFTLILFHVHSYEQYQRIVYSILLTTLSVSLYAIVQHFRLDPVLYQDEHHYRPVSTLGNPLFLASYLIITIFITLEQLVSGFHKLIKRVVYKEGNKPVHYLILFVISVSFIFIIQLLSIIYTKSRGPFLAVITGLFFFLLLCFIAHRNKAKRLKKRETDLMKFTKLVSIVPMILILLIILSFLLLAIPDSPVSFLIDYPYMKRLGTTFNLSAPSAVDRLAHWKGAIEMMGQKEPLEYTNDHIDRINKLRLFIGYGPETTALLYNRYYPYELTSRFMSESAYKKTIDRVHNEFFDALVTTGLLGVIATLILYVAIFHYSLVLLNFISSKREKHIFFITVTTLCFSGVILAFFLTNELAYTGIVLPVCLILALLLYIVSKIPAKKSYDKPFSWYLLIISLFSAILTHFAEVQTGIVVVSSRVHFWIFLALLIVTGQRGFAKRES